MEGWGWFHVFWLVVWREGFAWVPTPAHQG